ncbi:MAG: pseudouridine synthase [Fervidobacterium sp.]
MGNKKIDEKMCRINNKLNTSIDRMRLDRFLSNSHVGTRSEVRNYIKQKRVKVNNIIITDPSYHVTQNDIVMFDEKVIEPHRKVYIKFHKPAGFVSTTAEDEPSVLNLISHPYVSELHIAGRLDKDVEGLLILTNDGDFTHKLISPKNHVEKEYYIYFPHLVNITDKMIKQIERGLDLGHYRTLPGKLKQIDEKTISITIIEGKYHQIKLMCKFLGFTNWEKIVRIRIGNLTLGSLPKNCWLEIGEEEIKEKVFGRTFGETKKAKVCYGHQVLYQQK